MAHHEDRRFALVASAVALLVVLIAVASTLAWARPTGKNFVANVEFEVERQLAILDEWTSASDVSAYMTPSTLLDVPALLQYPELPSGCESVAMTNLLRYYGFSVEKTELADGWLVTSESDFVHAFMGDATAVDGGTCMVPAVVDAANAYLAAHDARLRACDMTGLAFSEVLAAVSEGSPVVVWCTIDLEEPGDAYASVWEDGVEYRLLEPSHCVVVSGYDLDAGVVYVSDSLAGQVSYPIEAFAVRYYELGMQAIALSGDGSYSYSEPTISSAA